MQAVKSDVTEFRSHQMPALGLAAEGAPPQDWAAGGLMQNCSKLGCSPLGHCPSCPAATSHGWDSKGASQCSNVPHLVPPLGIVTGHAQLLHHECKMLAGALPAPAAEVHAPAGVTLIVQLHCVVVAGAAGSQEAKLREGLS